MHTTLRTPMAAAPNRSACSARRLRSRHTNCITGSIPVSTRMREAARAETCGCAALLSVQFTASAKPRRVSAARTIEAGSAESVVCISAVTTNSPASRSRCRWLSGSPPLVTGWGSRGVLRRLPAGRSHPVPAGQEVLPGRGLLEPPVGGALDVEHVVAPQRQLPGALPRLDPHALHLGNHLAVAVLEGPAAGAVPKVLRTAHRAR